MSVIEGSFDILYLPLSFCHLDFNGYSFYKMTGYSSDCRTSIFLLPHEFVHLRVCSCHTCFVS